MADEQATQAQPSEAQSQQSQPGSLADMASSEVGAVSNESDIQSQGQPGEGDVSQEQKDSQAQESEPNQWHWDDGVRGDGDRPDWLQERYKSVADQAKAYSELEKKFGEFKGAPKDGYNFDAVQQLDKDDPLLQHFSQTFKDLNLSQKGFERIASEFIELQNQSAQKQMQEEFKKLGPDAKQQVTQAVNWINNTFNDDVAKTMQTWMQTAQDVEAIKGLMAMSPKSNAPTHDSIASSQPDYESVQEVINEKQANWQRYKDEENYRNSLKRRLQKAHDRETKLKR